MSYTSEQLRNIFQSKFNLNDWTQFLINYFGARTIRQVPEQLELDASEGKGFYLGQKSTNDNYEIGLFYIKTNSSIVKRRVGLRQIIKPYLRYLVDAALVVFDDGDNWRLSFICDIKGESTSPKRFTFVFGDSENYYNTAISRFLKLQSEGISFTSIKDAFSVEALTKQFYQDLFEWYQWAVSDESNITFPNNPATEEDDREDIDIKIIRMITRMMFVWFIKQKDLVPNKIFDTSYLDSILKDFDPQSTTVGNFYNAILQNLFFATLNREIVDENGTTRRFATAAKRDIKTLYRYKELFKISEENVIDLFANVPFLNGGLFECLDKTRYIDGVEIAYNYDGFSRNDRTFADGRYKHRAIIPNIIFFEPEKGLIPILNRYNFTIVENSPEEQQVALDPELLGKVFENLLGAYNPETKETARNQSGSFYTPREIVNYMVDESLIAYLGDNDIVRSLFKTDFSYDSSKKNEYNAIIEKLKSVKILDPACGSGAFPMGLLNRMVEIMHKLEVSDSTYDLKLSIIENCIYGSDIQSIAAQITKLRFFISLICDCEKDASKPNFGIPTLPNLETKFVSADSLIAKKQAEVQRNLFENPEIEPTKKALASVRHQHFSAKSASVKHTLRLKDKELREKLAKLLSDDNNFAPEDAKQLAAWNPYDQNAVSPFFDPQWMFGISDGFDIVIGNPPILRGRDIKRYGYDWANLWLIYIPWHFPYQFDESIQGASEKAEKAFREQYSAVYSHMLQYKEPLSKRNKAETGIRYEWYAMQRWGAKYWEDFLKPKIIYPNMTKYMPFVFDNKRYLTNQKCFIITGEYVAYLTAFFNSSLFKYCFRDSFPELQGGTRELSKIFFDKIPVYKVSETQNLQFLYAVEDIQKEYNKQKAQRIDSMLFDLYALTAEERKIIGFVEIV